MLRAVVSDEAIAVLECDGLDAVAAWLVERFPQWRQARGEE